ncbi:hypothetical protein SESBI_22605 [Sesbania bispinosa]|nr:hypothetical protein SESBI_22605 [Sesbania bispinosa]
MHTSEEFQGHPPTNNGDVMDENVQQVWEQRLSVINTVWSQGERLEPNEDILLKALKAPEHPGCVRAMGYGVCKTRLLATSSGKKEAKVDKSKFEAMKKELIYLWGKVENNDQSIKKLTKENMGEPSRSGNSCSPIIPEGVTPCDLYSDNPSYHLVGRGSVYNQFGDTLHNRPLPAEHVRVGVEIVFEGNAPLHVPNEDAGLIILDDALGAHVAWPIGLIDLKITHSTQSKDNEKDTRNTKESVASRKETDVQKLVKLIGFSKNNIHTVSSLLCYVKEGYTIGHQWDVPCPWRFSI